MRANRRFSATTLAAIFTVLTVVSFAVAHGQHRPPSIKVAAGDGANADRFGEAVAVSGDTMVVGAFLDDRGVEENVGSAYVFVRNGNVWVQQAKLTANDGAEDDRFGSSVAILKDTIVVGAMGDDIEGNPSPNQGSAYVFTRTNGTWAQRRKLVVSDNFDIQNFGFSAAISGETLIIGTLEDVGGNESQGSAYIYKGREDIWELEARLVAPDAETFDRFGWSVGVSDTTVIIGAYLGDVGNQNDQGSAYIFVKNGEIWAFQAKLTAADGRQFEEFGWSVDVSGDTAIVGAREDEIGDFPGQGSAYVFVRNGNTWTQQAKLIDEAGFPYSRFGWSVAVSGNTAAVGAMFGDVDQNFQDEGTAYVFVRNGSTWRRRARLVAPDAQRLDGFGSSVAIGGNRIVVGSEDGTVGPNSDQGSAYVFSLNVGPAPFDFDGDDRSDISVFRPSNGFWHWVNSGNGTFSAANFGLGSDRTAPEDFDGDGKDDLAVWRDEPNAPDRANFYILQSSDNSVRIAQFGRTGDVPVVGDWDGDGSADPAVYRTGSGGQNTFYYRPSSRLSVDFNAIEWGVAGDRAVRGDFDGDGRLDAAIFRPSDATWYILQSATGQPRYVNWGLSGDDLVPADYDGDGTTDVATFRNGTWYITLSSDGQPRYVNFGIASDVPVPSDYDGDGAADIAVFRDGIWYIDRSSAGFTATRFGLATDRAVADSGN
jgi:hypothetical protein